MERLPGSLRRGMTYLTHPIGGFPVCRHVGQNRAEPLAPGYQVKPEECIEGFRTVKVGGHQ